MNIYDFTVQYQKELWHKPSHRRASLSKVHRFNEWRTLNLDEVTAVICIEYRRYLEKSGIKGATINRHLSAIGAVLTFAMNIGAIKSKPSVGLTRQEEPDTRAFTKEQVREMIQHHVNNGDHWVADMIRLSCLTGMRLGEIIALPQVDINPSTMELWLPPKVTKTNQGRFVSLAAGDALKAAERLQSCIARVYTPRKFRDRWDDVKSRMGFRTQGWFKFHACRHFAASNMANAHMNVLVVANQLGHRSIATTQKYYHGSAKARAEAVSALSF